MHACGGEPGDEASIAQEWFSITIPISTNQSYSVVYYLKGQGPGQAVVKMNPDGMLIFAELDTKKGSGGIHVCIIAIPSGTKEYPYACVQ